MTHEERLDAHALRLSGLEISIAALEGSLAALVSVTEEVSKGLTQVLRTQPGRAQAKLSDAEMEALAWIVEKRSSA